MMTLDEFKKEADEAAEAYGKTLNGLLVKALEAKLDPKILYSILVQSWEKNDAVL